MATRTTLRSPARKASPLPARKRSSASAPRRKSTSTPNGSHSAARGSAYLPEVAEYIASAPAFAQPILHHLRELIHKTLPDVEEAVKWGHPFFIYRGLMLGNMAGFKQHCSLGLWGREAAADLRADGVYNREAMGVLGKLTSLKDLPSDRELAGYLRTAAADIDTGARTRNYSRPKPSNPKPPPEVPTSLTAALKKNKAAATHFAAMPPGCQREYCEWIAEAKRDETRHKRVATAVQWIAEGKRRNWKYENC
jgi:uncharacterized protein YdeI (YjbR/CyaY-like superfamily)